MIKLVLILLFFTVDGFAATKVRPLYLSPTSGSTQVSSTRDYISVKGVTFRGSETSAIYSNLDSSVSVSGVLNVAQVSGIDKLTFSDGTSMTSAGASGSINAATLQGQNGAYYLSRANHTGTQLASTVSDFNEASQDSVGGILTDTSSISWTYDDSGGQIRAQFNNVAGYITSASLPVITGTAPVSYTGNNISLNYNPNNLKITSNQLNTIQDIASTSSPSFAGLTTTGDITSTGNTITAGFFSGNGSLLSNVNASLLNSQNAAFYLARANHTGTQTASTISDFNEASQDSVGSILTDTTSISWTYDDAGNAIKAAFINNAGYITASGITATAPISYTASNIAINYNPTNLKVTSNQLNTAQDVSNTSSPTFAGLTLSGDVTSSSKITAGSFIGNGANVSNVNATLLNSQAGSFYLDRTNHTGTQVSTTISDFNEAAQDAVGTILTNNNPITWTYNDASNTVTAGLNYNTTNFKLTNNFLNTAQDISNTSSVTFAGITSSDGVTASGNIVTTGNIAAASGALSGSLSVSGITNSVGITNTGILTQSGSTSFTSKATIQASKGNGYVFQVENTSNVNGSSGMRVDGFTNGMFVLASGGSGGAGYGGYFSNTNNLGGNIGIRSHINGASSGQYSGYFISTASGGTETAAYGETTSASPSIAYGMYGKVNNTGGFGLYGINSTGGYGGYFSGPGIITGSLTVNMATSATLGGTALGVSGVVSASAGLVSNGPISATTTTGGVYAIAATNDHATGAAVYVNQNNSSGYGLFVNTGRNFFGGEVKIGNPSSSTLANSPPQGASMLIQRNTTLGLNGSLAISSTGTAIRISTLGSNRGAGTFALSAGAATISNTSVTSNTLIFLTGTGSSNLGDLSVSSQTSGVGFNATSSNILDARTVNYLFIEPF